MSPIMMNRRLTVGRLAFYVEPRDVWVGAYVARRAVYVCPLPCVVIRWDRDAPVSAAVSP